MMIEEEDVMVPVSHCTTSKYLFVDASTRGIEAKMNRLHGDGIA
jgi:hypothetical protein